MKLFIILLALLVMTGCGREGGQTEVEKQFPSEAGKQWNAVHIPLPGQYELADIEDDKIYACRYGADGLYISIFETGSTALIKELFVPGVTEVKGFSVDSAGEICLFGSTGNGDVFWRVNADGEISSVGEMEVENLGKLPVLKNIYADRNGLYYLWYEMSVLCAEVYENGEKDIYTRLDRIYVKDQQMNTIIYEEVPDSYHNKLLGFAFDEAGVPMLLARDEEGYYIRQMRTTACEEYEARRIGTDELSNLENAGSIAFTRDGLLYTQAGFLYRYFLSDSGNERLLDLAGVGILEEDIIYLGLRDGVIEIIDNYPGLQQSEYTIIREGETERKRLTLGVMTLQPDMEKTVAAFNRCQSEVTVEPVIYAADYDFEAGYERLSLDMIQGKAPDLISVYGIEEYESLAKAGAFADLYLFMGQDEEINAESLVPSVIKAYEMEGHLYTAAPTFRLYTMWGAASVVEGQSGVNLEEMLALLRENGGDLDSIYGLSADESPLTTLCAFDMDKLIDWENGTCDFTGEEFRQILRFAGEYKGKAYGSLYKAIRSGEILLTLGLITSVEDYRLQSELYGEKVQFIGFPTESGTGTAVLFSGDELAINAGSGFQEEAWEFMKFFIKYGHSGTGFPVEKKQLEAVFREALAEAPVEDNGEMRAGAQKSYSEKDIVSIQVYRCEPEDVEAVRTLIEMVGGKFRYHTEIQKIIAEEAAAYLQKQKTIDEVCAIIQSRVQLYLNERK